MATQVLPVTVDGDWFAFQVDLDGEEYGFELKWNGRSSVWSYILSDVESVPIYCGAVVQGCDLLRQCNDARRPPGRLLAVDPAGLTADASETDLGVRVLLLYTPVAEVDPSTFVIY